MNPPFDWAVGGQQNEAERNQLIPTVFTNRQHKNVIQRAEAFPSGQQYTCEYGGIRARSFLDGTDDSLSLDGDGLKSERKSENTRKFYHVSQQFTTVSELATRLPNALSMSSPTIDAISSNKALKLDDLVQSKIVATSVQVGLSELLNPSSSSPIVPTFSITSSEVMVYEVQFKRSSSDYILHARVTTPILLGDLVVVSAERGCEDLGCVTRIRSLSEFMIERQIPDFSPEGKPFNLNKHCNKIVRLATTREQRMLGMKAVDEEDVRRYCQHIATNSFRLPITITDVDFQFDRRKVTVYYSTTQAQQRVDFRDLVAHLSDVYKTRVWMVGS